eukprot:1912160-Rhodomonas_salina.5
MCGCLDGEGTSAVAVSALAFSLSLCLSVSLSLCPSVSLSPSHLLHTPLRSQPQPLTTHAPARQRASVAALLAREVDAAGNLDPGCHALASHFNPTHRARFQPASRTSRSSTSTSSSASASLSDDDDGGERHEQREAGAVLEEEEVASMLDVVRCICC